MEGHACVGFEPCSPWRRLLTLVLPASAQAGSIIRESDTRVNLFCEDVTAGNAHLFLFAETSDTFGSFTDLAIWSGSLSGDPDLVGDSSSIVLTPTGGSGSVALVELNGDPAGTRDAECHVRAVRAGRAVRVHRR